MAATADLAEPDHLGGWAARCAPSRRRGRRPAPALGGLRFAFYGRISTSQYQDPVSPRQWQRDSAQSVIAGHGLIIAEFFDVGLSRSVPWNHRTQAAALLQAVQHPDRDFDAIVVGEYERAFYRDQLGQMLPWLARHHVSIWHPEAGGPVTSTTRSIKP